MRKHRSKSAEETTRPDATARRDTGTPSADVQEALATGPITPAIALALQRSIGNAAVLSLLERQRVSQPPAVQRSTVSDVLRAPGRPLSEDLRADMETRLGADFTDVRLHEGAAAAQSAAEVGARAYTSGNHVVVGDGGIDKHTLAHELTHVIQQRQGPVAGTDHGDGMRVSDPSDRFERAAEANARRAMAGPTEVQRHAAEDHDEATSHAGSAHTGAPIQRAKLNIRDKDGTISGVSKWPSRPSSNLSGTQGQHRTAYVVFEDAILNRVADRTPVDAAGELIKLLGEYAALPGMQQQNAKYLQDACVETIKILTYAQAKNDPAAIGEQIDVVLQIRNKVPGTAERGEGGGHGESKSAGIVSEVEKYLRTKTPFPTAWGTNASIADQVRHAMWTLYDYDPSAPSDDAATKKIAAAVLTHYLSLRSAYPETWNWLTVNGYYLADFFLKNRKAAGMPLTKLTDDQFNAVIVLVYAGL